MKFSATANPRIKSLSEVVQLSPSDMRRVTSDVDVVFRALSKRLFSSQGRSGGASWPRLSSGYAKQKRRTHPGRKIMQRSGRLRKGLVNRSHPDHVARHTRDKVKIGVRSALPAYHGAVKNRQNPRLPKRNVFQMTRKQRRGYFRIVSDYIVRIKINREWRFKMARGRAEMRARR